MDSGVQPVSESECISRLIAEWKVDRASTYNTWFLWADRLKNFRSIRRGIKQVVGEIDVGSFGSAFKGSSLETVVGSIAEQRQIFKGADHAFIWKPKLRIPDIYENDENKRSFAQFLDTCLCCDDEDAVIAAIRDIDARRIKGLGPACANMLYFLHPSIVPPFNTAIVAGYNALTGSKVKLGRWDQYLAMRQGIVKLNDRHRTLLSNDLGAIAALLFDLGCGRLLAPPKNDDPAVRAQWKADLGRVRDENARALASKVPVDGDRTHTEIQGWLRDLGTALGYDVWIPLPDKGREHGQGRLGDGCLTALPSGLLNAPGSDAVRMIDVIWFDRAGSTVVAAFEVEHTTSIYSGIVRLLDLALGIASGTIHGLFLVAPDDREQKVRAQLGRPAFAKIRDLSIRFLPYSELETHRISMARFGHGMKAVEAIARVLD